MSKEKIEAKTKDKKKKEISKAALDTIITASNVERRRVALTRNLKSILGEKLEFTDKFGTARTVVGKKNGEGTFGYEDVFEVPEIKGHPFEEVSRNMAEHFKMYCLVNGVSDEDMLSMSYGEPAPELADVLRDLKKDFFLMVANKDLDAITDYYAGIANYIEKKLPDLMQCDDLRNIPRNEDNILLISGKESYLVQTIQLGTRDSIESLSEEQREVIQNTDNKLKSQGKNYSLLSVSHAISGFEFFAQSLLNNNEFEIPKSMKYEEIIDLTRDDPLFKPVMRGCALTEGIRKSKADGLSKGIDYNHSFPDYQTDFEVVNYPMMQVDAIMDDEVGKFSLSPADQLVFANDLSTRAAKLNGKKAPKPISSLAGSIGQIKLIEEKIKTDPASLQYDEYIQLGNLYESVATTSSMIISSEEDEYSDSEYSFAFDCKDFSEKGLLNPEISQARNRLKLMTDAMKNHMVAELQEFNKINSGILAMNDTLSKFMQEPFTHTDSKGVVRTISGVHNDPEKGTLGVKDVFTTPEYLGKPFLEVSRNMFSHFKIYCLTQGLTEDELLSIERSELTPELHNKLLGWKGSFLDMIIEKDFDRISDMYVGICEMVNKDGDRILSLRPANAECFRKDHALYLKYSGSQNWYSQTFNHGLKSETPESKELIALVNSKLANKGYDFTFDCLAVPLKTVGAVQQASKLTTGGEKLPTSGEELDAKPFILQTINIVDAWPSYLLDKYEEHHQNNPDASWLSSFTGLEQAAILETGQFALGDKNATIARNIAHNQGYGIGKETKPKGKGGKNDLSFAEIKKMLDKTIAKSRRALLRHPDKPDKNALTSFIAANEFLKNPSKFAGKNVKDFADVAAQIDSGAALAAFGNLSKDEKKALLSGSADGNEYVDFIDDYTYNAELNAKEAERAKAEELEEQKALMEFYARPAKDYYVEQQKELGNILNEAGKFPPENAEALPADRIKDCLAKMIAAKQTQLLIHDTSYLATEEQIKNVTSKEAIENKASELKKDPMFEDLANSLLQSKDLANLSIGAEQLLDPNGVVMHGTSEQSEKMIGDVTKYYTAIKDFADVRTKWTSTRGQHDDIVTSECVSKLNNIHEKYKDFDCISILCANGGGNIYKKALQYVELGSQQISKDDCEKMSEIFKAGDAAKERFKAQGIKVNDKGIPENIKTGWNCTKSGYEAKQSELNQGEKAAEKQEKSMI